MNIEQGQGRECPSCGALIAENGYIVCKRCWGRVDVTTRRSLAVTQQKAHPEAYRAAVIDAARKARM